MTAKNTPRPETVARLYDLLPRVYRVRDDGKLVIASADGTNEELQLRQGKATPPPPPPAPPKRYAGDQQKNTWWGSGKKQKSLFDLLFGN